MKNLRRLNEINIRKTHRKLLLRLESCIQTQNPNHLIELLGPGFLRSGCSAGAN